MKALTLLVLVSSITLTQVGPRITRMRSGSNPCNPSVIVRRLETETDVSARRALILSLGKFTGEQLSITKRKPLIAKLLRWYRSDPDPGIHAAIDWLLRYGRQGERPRALDWRQSLALARIDEQLAGRAPEKRNWYVSKAGHTMVVLHGPVEFRMGSPADEIGRVPASDSPDEPLQQVRIPRSFAIASKEVTVAQFRRFLEANPDVKNKHAYAGNPSRMSEVMRQFSPDDAGPQIAVTWYEAAMYCNWLSQQDGLPESEWVYPKSFEEFKNGMQLPKDYLHRSGYRLPTEAEWEYAARAGSVTARFYGNSDSLLKEYAWYSANPPKHKNDPVDPRDPQRTWPVGQLKPNDFGLFDVYGNVWEWTQDRMQQYPESAIRDDVEDTVLSVSDSEARARRGGGFPYEAAMMRSAARGTKTAFPMLRRDNVGFRVARTYR
jgi:formylglycine-generating enzyme required for sulfatase activity